MLRVCSGRRSHVSFCVAWPVQDKGSFLYLAYIGVRPDHQGRGLGSVMLQHLLDECDRQGKWAYLEASNDDNARLYKR